MRGAAGAVERIVEERDATDAERRIAECNSGTWLLDVAVCVPLLDRLPRAPNGERYLTDVVPLVRDAVPPSMTATGA